MTSTGNAVGMEPQSGGMRHENSTVEAIGRLEELAGWFADDSVDHMLAGSVAKEHSADLRLVLESRRHSVEREAGLREALEAIAEGRDVGRHDGLPEDGPAHDADTMFALARAALDRRAG